jgi:hypothetical protein
LKSQYIRGQLWDFVWQIWISRGGERKIEEEEKKINGVNCHAPPILPCTGPIKSSHSGTSNDTMKGKFWLSGGAAHNDWRTQASPNMLDRALQMSFTFCFLIILYLFKYQIASYPTWLLWKNKCENKKKPWMLILKLLLSIIF